MKKNDYADLLMRLVEHEELQSQITELEIQIEDVEAQIIHIAPHGQTVVNFDEKTFLINNNGQSVSIAVVPEIFVTELDPE